MNGLCGKDLLIRDLKKKIRNLEAENSQMHSLLDGMTEERNYIQYCLDETRKSFSYRLGYAITAIPRKFRKQAKRKD